MEFNPQISFALIVQFSSIALQGNVANQSV